MTASLNGVENSILPPGLAHSVPFVLNALPRLPFNIQLKPPPLGSPLGFLYRVD